MLSLILSIFLFIYPLIWKGLDGGEKSLSLVYLIIFLPAAILIYPSIRYLEKKNKINHAIRAGWSFLFLGFSYFLLQNQNESTLYVLGILFFLGITIFQSVLPSLLSLYVSDQMRATGTGPYYILSFLGHAVGSITAGYIYSKSSLFSFPSSYGLIFITFIVLTLWTLIGIPSYRKGK